MAQCYTCARWSAASKNILHPKVTHDPDTWFKPCVYHVTLIPLDMIHLIIPPYTDEIRWQIAS